MLSTLQQPIANLMDRLKYPQKFMLVSGVFILPILILLFFTWGTLREDIQFAHTEQDGVQVIQMATRQLNAIVAGQTPPVISAQEASQIQNLVDSLSAGKEYQALRSATDPQQAQNAALQLIARINDTSNLILDPELASYFVGDVTIGKLPLLMTLWRNYPTKMQIAQRPN